MITVKLKTNHISKSGGGLSQIQGHFRCGRKFEGVSTFPDGEFTEAEMKQLNTDPILMVKVSKDAEPETPAPEPDVPAEETTETAQVVPAALDPDAEVETPEPEVDAADEAPAADSDSESESEEAPEEDAELAEGETSVTDPAMTVIELRELCNKESLTTKGLRKAELVQQLLAAGYK